jgi:hypothetical protein
VRGSDVRTRKKTIPELIHLSNRFNPLQSHILLSALGSSFAVDDARASSEAWRSWLAANGIDESLANVVPSPSTMAAAMLTPERTCLEQCHRARRT